ncbi:AzlC family ABC transporter permease [Natronolimnohabitans innermongolicus]|uniref:AzlC family protein n=1 Tax=Natronolimnohabitans innermongolicus JCM 12255 TaxID=1227499 RepID=L9XBY1_9EURY|nr:AzlC family ABC transporter permease [Natronolimnohabitans innermongolicus]ELY58941.1 AzlC family protein [Natronolimnohabitans innermongolicus JCM 12255]
MRNDSESDEPAARAASTAVEDGSEPPSAAVSASKSESQSGPGSGSEPPADEDVSFGWEGVRTGFLTGIPIAIGVGGYGIAFGVLAAQAGLSVAEAALMSATVLAGASQIIAVELWADPIPIAAIVATTFAVNLRYSLMGAALQPWFRHLEPRQIYASLLVMADENWALTMRELKSGSGYGAFLLGSGIVLWLLWVGSTVVGVLAGDVVGEPAQYGFDFILAAVFVALAVELWDGASTLVPWLVALGTSVVAATVLPGRWYILIGGLAAAAVEVVRYDR